MNFFKENPLIAGLAVVALLVIAGGGYMVLQKGSAFALAREDYDNQVAALHRLQNASPYPSTENVAATKDAVEELRNALLQLEQTTRQFVPPVPEDITPQQFQDQLRQQVSAITTKAREAGVQLPDTFYLGFDQFQTGLPTAVEAPFLARQLEIIRWLVERAIEAGVTRIDVLQRGELPVEQDPAKREFPENPGPDDIVRRNTIIFGISGEQGRVRRTFNELVRAPQFLIIRSLEFRNSNPQPPVKGAEGADATTAVPVEDSLASLFGGPAEADSPATGGGESLTIILGRESLQATFALEILDFAPLKLD
jgi:hypothetical protein